MNPMNKKDKIYICGHKGMVGSSLIRLFNKNGYTNLVTSEKSKVNFLDQKKVKKFLKSENNNDLMKKIDISKVLLSTNHAPEGWAECIHNIFTQIKLQEHTYV